MSSALHLTTRDLAIVEALVLKVRLFSQSQIVDHWWNGQLTNGRRRLKRLAARNLVRRIIVMARPTPILESPLVRWRPGESAPDFGQVAWSCQKRWRQRPAKHCVAWMATRKAAQIFGGVARSELRHVTQVTHDLGVAAVWLRLEAVEPQWAAAWQGEDVMACTRRGEKIPDAFIVVNDGRVAAVIEFGGSYNAARVRAFHQDCVSRNLPYQLW